MILLRPNLFVTPSIGIVLWNIVSGQCGLISLHLRVPSNRVAMVSKKVFWGAIRPRRPGIFQSPQLRHSRNVQNLGCHFTHKSFFVLFLKWSSSNWPEKERDKLKFREKCGQKWNLFRFFFSSHQRWILFTTKAEFLQVLVHRTIPL